MFKLLVPVVLVVILVVAVVLVVVVVVVEVMEVTMVVERPVSSEWRWWFSFNLYLTVRLCIEVEQLQQAPGSPRRGIPP